MIAADGDDMAASEKLARAVDVPRPVRNVPSAQDPVDPQPCKLLQCVFEKPILGVHIAEQADSTFEKVFHCSGQTIGRVHRGYGGWVRQGG